MNKSLPTASSTPGSPKKKRSIKAWAVLACALVFLGLSVPAAFAAATLDGSAAIDGSVNPAEPSVHITSTLPAGASPTPINVVVSVTHGASFNVALAEVTPPATSAVMPPFTVSVPFGETLTVAESGVVMASYTNNVRPSPTSVSPLVPGWNGAEVTIPVANGHYEYVNSATGAVLSAGVHPVAVGATLSVSARATQSDTVLTTTGPWIHTHVPPVVQDADGDGVPDGTDQCPTTPAHQSVNEVGCAIGLAPIVTLTGTHNATATADGSADFTVENPNEVGITYQVNVSGGGGLTSLSVDAGATATLTIRRPSGDYALSLRAAGSVTDPVAFTIGSDAEETTPTPAQAPVLPTFVDMTGKLTVPAQGDNTPNAWTYVLGGTPVSASGDAATVTGTVSVVIWLKPGFSYDGHIAPYSITKTYTATVVAQPGPADKPVEQSVNKPADTSTSTPQTATPVKTTAAPTTQHAEQTAAANNRWAPDLAASGTSQSATSRDGLSAGWVSVALFAALVAAGAGLAPRRRTRRVLSK